MFRILLVPVFILAYWLDENGIKVYAIIVYAVAALSDFLDGFIARKCNLISALGKVLDPLGDKLMMVSALMCITIDRIIPAWAVIIVFTKEAVMGLGGLVIHRKHFEIPPSNILGKVSTVVFIAVCLALMIFHDIRKYAAVMVFIAIALMFMALGSYIIVFIGVIKRGKKVNPE
jgi:CDP-diacylglycerol--glycerol-3-phosphate 3-phosphatidyltransferase